MDLNKFIQDITLYLAVNWEVYNNDEKKIAFLLSYMTEGNTVSWKEEFLVQKIDEVDKADEDLALIHTKKYEMQLKSHLNLLMGLETPSKKWKTSE